MSKINLGINKVEILDTGTIIQFNNQPIEFDFNFPNFPLKIIMDFENKDDPSIDSIMKPNLINDTTVKLSFLNFNNSIGAGNTKPLSIGTYQGKHIYLNYRIYALNDFTDKTIHYTFYLSEEKL